VVTTGMRGASLLMALAVVLSLAALDARPAEACSCAQAGSMEEEFQRSGAVFSGKVSEVGGLTPERDGITTRVRPYLAPVTFDVNAAWKGVSGDTAVVYGQGPGASCGLNFELGETYLVFASGAETGKESPLQTNFCSATRQMGEETARNMFGPPAALLPETGGVSPEGIGQTRVAVTVALVLLAAGALIARRAVVAPRR
jgi:hypothetical protein